MWKKQQENFSISDIFVIHMSGIKPKDAFPLNLAYNTDIIQVHLLLFYSHDPLLIY